jgi:hypothetical protein
MILELGRIGFYLSTFAEQLHFSGSKPGRMSILVFFKI